MWGMPFTIDLGTSLTDHPLLGLALTFAGGVVTSLTPCLYPMIPITAAIVGGGTTAEGAVAPAGARLCSPWPMSWG